MTIKLTKAQEGLMKIAEIDGSVFLPHGDPNETALVSLALLEREAGRWFSLTPAGKQHLEEIKKL